MGALQIGPLTKYIYKTSVSLRGEYWQAGWNMGSEHPLTGVGFDAYGDWYRRARDTQALILPGPNTTTNAAHNVPFDVFAFGGWPLFASYLAILALSVIAIIKVTRRNRKYDSVFVTLTTAWLCYQLQSIISINQLGLVVWGWVLGGLILGVRSAENNEGDTPENDLKLKKKKFDVDQFTVVITLVAILGSFVSMPVVISDHKFKLAIDSKKALDLYNSANSWPPITKKMVLVTAILNENKIYKEAKLLSERTVQINPDSFEAWIIYSQNPLVSELEMIEIKRQLLRLDPNIAKLGGIDKYLAKRFPKS
jgi:hypothetical protein